MYNRVLSGQRLTPEQRQDFINQAEQLFNTQAATYNEVVGHYHGLAEQYRLNPERIAATHRFVEQSTPDEAISYEEYFKE